MKTKLTKITSIFASTLLVLTLVSCKGPENIRENQKNDMKTSQNSSGDDKSDQKDSNDDKSRDGSEEQDKNKKQDKNEEQDKSKDTSNLPKFSFGIEKTKMQMMSRHWDEDEFKTRFQDFSKSLSQGKGIYEFLADDIKTDPKKKITEYFDKFEKKDVSYAYTRCHLLEQVKETDEYNDLRGILEYRFRVKDGDKTTEYTTMLKVARLGDSKGMKWKIYDMVYTDTGVDVSDVKLTQLDKPIKGEEICIMKTEAGEIKIRLFPEQAPKAVKNWIELSKKGFYDSMPFERVIKDFVIQGGALDGSGNESKSIYNGFFEDEVGKGLYHFNGALALGNNGPHTNGNQFYIVECRDVDEKVLPLMSLPENVQKKYKEVGGLPELDGRYTVFGQVYEGMDVVRWISKQETDKDDKPLKNPLKIHTITFEKVK